MVLVKVLESQIVRRVALQRQQVEALQRSQVQRADAVMRATQGGDAAAAMHAEPLQEMFSEAANLSSSTRMMDQDIERLRHADIRSWKSDEEQTRRYVLQLREDWVREIIKQRADARAEEHAERLAHPSTGDPRALQRSLNRMESKHELSKRIERRAKEQEAMAARWPRESREVMDGLFLTGVPQSARRPSTAPARPAWGVSESARERAPQKWTGLKQTATTAPSEPRRPRAPLLAAASISDGFMVCGMAAGPPGYAPIRTGQAIRSRAGDSLATQRRTAWA